MDPDESRPRLRRLLEAKPALVEGEQVFALRDPSKLSPYQAILPIPHFILATLLDGERTLRDAQAEFMRKTGVLVPFELLTSLVRALDEGLFLEGARIEALLQEWRERATREAACAGGSYPADAAALRSFLDAQPGGPPSPDGAPAVRAVVSPHIDFHRGGHVYARTWRAVAEACDAELFVVFGTAHAGTGSARFALTRKDYVTPLGTIPTDRALVDRLVRAYRGKDDLFEGEIAHKGEHSIEFQVVELAHLYVEKREVRVLPVLCGSLQDLVDEASSPSKDGRLVAFHDALAETLSDVPHEKVAFVAGVDLAHVGSDFDDPPLDDAGLGRVLESDRETLSLLVDAQDPDALHDDIARDESRKICGHSALVATLEAMRRQVGTRWPRLAGELLAHDRWYDGRSTVSFAGAVFRPAASRGGE